MNRTQSLLLSQGVPLALTFILCILLSVLYAGQIHILNYFTTDDISLQLRFVDILIGLTIYLKTAIDFALYIGNLMGKYPSWKDRVSIEIGSGVGNALGTMAILIAWTFFKEITWLLALMIIIAGLVLLKLAEESLEHAKQEGRIYSGSSPALVDRSIFYIEKGLDRVNRIFSPVLKYVIPSMSMKEDSMTKKSFWGLFVLAFTVPFILGLDDFAGYVSLFSVVNVFGFGVGVFLGHMILNIALYISPRHTIQAVKNRWVALIGSVAFIAIAVWGFYEVFHMLHIL
jgi:hypothetical protein